MKCLSIFIGLLASALVVARSDGLVQVEGGTFLMSDADLSDNPDGFSQFWDAHSVTLSSYRISATETTVADFEPFLEQAFVEGLIEFGKDLDFGGNIVESDGTFFYYFRDSRGIDFNPSGPAGNKFTVESGLGNLPVSGASWNAAVMFCNYLSEQYGFAAAFSFDQERETWILDQSANGFRLPTEVEWEFAARGGVESLRYIYSGSNDLDSVAWKRSNMSVPYRVRPVGSKQPNELGFYDFSGNASEWCYDFYQRSLGSDPVTDPVGPSEGDERVIRGSSIFGVGDSFEVVYRGRRAPNLDGGSGFRLARNAGADPESGGGETTPVLDSEKLQFVMTEGAGSSWLPHSFDGIVAVNGEWAFIGNIAGDFCSSCSQARGAVEVYRLVGGSWTPYQVITMPEDSSQNGSFFVDFGYSLASSGNTLAVSKHSRAFYLYRLVGNTWQLDQAYTNDVETVYSFGIDDAGENLVVGPTGKDLDNPGQATINAYIEHYSRSSESDSWSFSDYVIRSSPDQSLWDPATVAFDGLTLGLNNTDLSPDGRFLAVSRINIGVAMFVKAADGSWNFVQKIEPVSDSGGFAQRVALNNDYLVVADPSHRSAGRVGAIFVYVRGGTTWILDGSLDLPPNTYPTAGGNDGDFLGAIALGDRYLAAAYDDVGTHDFDERSRWGVVHLYVLRSNGWRYSETVTAKEAAQAVPLSDFAVSSFGRQMHIDDGHLMIGAGIEDASVGSSSSQSIGGFLYPLPAGGATGDGLPLEPITLNYKRVGGSDDTEILLSWQKDSGGQLQVAPRLEGPWYSVVGVDNPLVVSQSDPPAIVLPPGAAPFAAGNYFFRVVTNGTD